LGRASRVEGSGMKRNRIDDEALLGMTLFTLALHVAWP
jgi:hypothetical protein